MMLIYQIYVIGALIVRRKLKRPIEKYRLFSTTTAHFYDCQAINLKKDAHSKTPSNKIYILHIIRFHTKVLLKFQEINCSHREFDLSKDR